MKMHTEQLKLLGLSSKEVRVLCALRDGKNTPLAIAEHIKVRRPTVYQILPRLHKRGLAKTFIRERKKYWAYAKAHDLEQELYETKKALFDFEEGVEEVRGLSDSMVVVHRGKEAVRKLLRGILKDNKDQRL